AAAGVAGLMKVALSLHHRTLPPTLNFEHPNPHIPFQALNLQVQTTLEDWPCADEPARAGVSSFGFGGTNCHVVLEAAPRSATLLLPLAAASPALLRRRTLAALDLVTQAGSWSDAAALCRAIATHDDGGPYRIALTARDREKLAGELSAQLAEQGRARAAAPPPPKLVFVCSGQGSQWLGMGRSLLVQEPV